MSNETETTNEIVEAMKAPEAKKLSEAAHAELKRLFARISQAREQLGALYFQRAQLEAQAAAIVGKLAQDDGEAKAILDAAAKALGIAGQPGWRFDPTSGEFVRAT